MNFMWWRSCIVLVLGVPVLGTAKSKEGLQSPRKDCKVQWGQGKKVHAGLQKRQEQDKLVSSLSNAKLCRLSNTMAAHTGTNMEQDRRNLFLTPLLCDVPSNSFCRCCTVEIEDSSGCVLAVCTKGLFAAAFIWHCCQLFGFILLVGEEPWPADPSSLPGMLQGRQPSRVLWKGKRQPSRVLWKGMIQETLKPNWRRTSGTKGWSTASTLVPTSLCLQLSQWGGGLCWPLWKWHLPYSTWYKFIAFYGSSI